LIQPLITLSIFAVNIKNLHPKNTHNAPYDFEKLMETHSALKSFVFKNDFGTLTIDFSDQKSVLALNKAILMHHYKLADWNIPDGYLCPPIPSRADYIHHLNDVLKVTKDSNSIKGLDIGTGANCIYPILGTQIYNWQMVGADINEVSITSARNNVAMNKLSPKIEIRHQNDNAHIFKNIIKADEFYHFTMCNPPFHSSEDEATKGTLRKLKNLKIDKPTGLNFGGIANELWCNGGEALFLKRMIKESVLFSKQVGIFTSLASKKENLPKLEKLLKKKKADYRIIPMQQGNKQSRILVWKFN